MSRITEIYEKYINTIITVGSYFLGGLAMKTDTVAPAYRGDGG